MEPLLLEKISDSKQLHVAQTRELKSLGYGPSHDILPICKYEGPFWHLPYELDPTNPYDFHIPTINVCDIVSVDTSLPSIQMQLYPTCLNSTLHFDLQAVLGLKLYFVLHLQDREDRMIINIILSCISLTVVSQ